MYSHLTQKDLFPFFRCYDPTYCPDDPPVPIRNNTLYNIPSKNSLRYKDGEFITYTCQNSDFRFPLYDGTPKEDWKDNMDVVCGWENKWDPPQIIGCVDIRGCPEPPAT